MSYECARGNAAALIENCSELASCQPFEEYFLTNGYNSILIDKATRGNSLFFSLMYLTYKLDWKNVIPKFTDSQFMNLALGIQLSYRKNPYHNAIHAADVV